MSFQECPEGKIFKNAPTTKFWGKDLFHSQLYNFKCPNFKIPHNQIKCFHEPYKDFKKKTYENSGYSIIPLQMKEVKHHKWL